MVVGYPHLRGGGATSGFGLPATASTTTAAVAKAPAPTPAVARLTAAASGVPRLPCRSSDVGCGDGGVDGLRERWQRLRTDLSGLAPGGSIPTVAQTPELDLLSEIVVEDFVQGPVDAIPGQASALSSSEADAAPQMGAANLSPPGEREGTVNQEPPAIEERCFDFPVHVEISHIVAASPVAQPAAAAAPCLPRGLPLVPRPRPDVPLPPRTTQSDVSSGPPSARGEDIERSVDRGNDEPQHGAGVVVSRRAARQARIRELLRRLGEVSPYAFPVDAARVNARQQKAYERHLRQRSPCGAALTATRPSSASGTSSASFRRSRSLMDLVWSPEDEVPSDLGPVAAGMLDRLMAQLPAVLVDGKNEKWHDPCTICLEAMEEGEIAIVLPCVHYYHRDCIREWLRHSRLCPLCKRSALSEAAEAAAAS